MGVCFVLYCILQLPWLLRAASSDCQDKCGDIDIRSPFGMKSGWYHVSRFRVTCNETASLSLAAFIWSYLVGLPKATTSSLSTIQALHFSFRVDSGNLATLFRNNETTPISSCLQRSCGDMSSESGGCFVTISENFTSYTASTVEVINPGSKRCASAFLISKELADFTAYPGSSDRLLPPHPSLQFLYDYDISINATHFPAALEWNPCDLEVGLCDQIFKGVAAQAQHYRRQDLTCNETTDGPKVYITSIGLQLLNVSILEGTVVANNSITYSDCLETDGISVDLADTPFSFSAFYNRFRSVGCGSLATFFHGPIDKYPAVACMQPICGNVASDVDCTADFSWDLMAKNVDLLSLLTHVPVTLRWSTQIRGQCDCWSDYMYSTIDGEYNWSNLAEAIFVFASLIPMELFLLIHAKDHSLLDIVDPMVMNGGPEAEIVAVAKLAKRCLNLNRKKRPAMREVAFELEQIRSYEGANDIEENTDEDSDIYDMNEPSSTASCSLSSSIVNNSVTLSLDAYSLNA
ncbi:hypothetical protein GQ457_07G010620 [Hibiscus cannabinus]